MKIEECATQVHRHALPTEIVILARGRRLAVDADDIIVADVERADAIGYLFDAHSIAVIHIVGCVAP